jgi:hypothetical protein
MLGLANKGWRRGPALDGGVDVRSRHRGGHGGRISRASAWCCFAASEP